MLSCFLFVSLSLVSGCSFLIGEKPVLTPAISKNCPIKPAFRDQYRDYYGDYDLVLVKEADKEDDSYHYKYTECRYSYVTFNGDALRYDILDTMPLYMFNGSQFIGGYDPYEYGDRRYDPKAGYLRMQEVMEKMYSEEESRKEEIRQREIKKYNESPEGKAAIRQQQKREQAEAKQVNAICTMVAKDIESKYNVGKFLGVMGSISTGRLPMKDLYQCMLIYSQTSPYGYSIQRELLVVANGKTGAYEIQADY